jgi:steroid 5-alpha reductase family enzyme
VNVSGLPELFLLTGSVVVTSMLILWVVSLVMRNASIVDLFWGFGFVVIAWATWLALSERPALWLVTTGQQTTALALGAGGRPVAILVLVTAWGLRLTAYLSWRNIGKGEDFRYAAMREHWGGRFALVSLGTVFLLQGVLMWVVSLPVQAGMLEAGAIGVLAFVGVALWGVGMVFETIGDWQLARFKADPSNAGQVMDRGLWAYTRHPNYFGDFCVWWGIYLVALTPATWWTAVGPAVMTFLLLRFSGVTNLEKTITTRRPGYAQYVERTNAFFPGKPRA